ncbi:hypothetical protein C8J57DRAFT_1708077 [Mycena rebaudengoi]|nr:hypothetical protein C8J57DRAFT_1708077 [Mycena rebaudengoi]
MNQAHRDSGDAHAPKFYPWSSSTDPHSSTESSPVDRSPLSDIFDRTSLDIAFDHSCCDALDDQLLHHPLLSLADVFWADAVHDVPHERLILSPIREDPPTPLSGDAERHQPDRPLTDRLNVLEKSLAGEPFEAKASSTSLPNTRSINARDGSFIFFEPHFTTSDPSESIGLFPVRSRRSRSRSSKIPSRIFGYFHAQRL